MHRLRAAAGGPAHAISLALPLAHGDAGFLLALWARWNLRAKEVWVDSLPALPSPISAPQSQPKPALQPAVSEIQDGNRYTVSAYGRYVELEENAVVTA